MSNLGLERHLAAQGLGLVRTNVGDRHVLEKMRGSGYNVGGEQSGHIILADYATTGDGLVAALQALRRGLGSETALWMQRRYRLLFALIGLAMLAG